MRKSIYDINITEITDEKSIREIIENSLKEIRISDQLILRARSLFEDEKIVLSNYEAVLDYYRLQSSDLLGVDVWIKYSRWFITFGLFRLSLLFRNKAKERLKTDHQKEGRIRLRYFHTLMEDEKFDELETILPSINNESTRQTFQNVVSILNHKNREQLAKIDKKYCDFIRNKDIVIAGPLFEGKLPESYNKHLVVRNNISLLTYDRQAPVNVSYYNFTAAQAVKDEVEILKDKLDYLAMKYGVQDISGERIHILDHYDVIYLLGEQNMLQSMIIDLVLHEVKSIFVTGNNLFLGKRVHSESYFSRNQPREVMLWSFAIHNPFSNFIILQLLYRAETFTGDAVMSEIMNGSVEEYAAKMESIYGDFV